MFFSCKIKIFSSFFMIISGKKARQAKTKKACIDTRTKNRQEKHTTKKARPCYIGLVSCHHIRACFLIISGQNIRACYPGFIRLLIYRIFFYIRLLSCFRHLNYLSMTVAVLYRYAIHQNFVARIYR